MIPKEQWSYPSYINQTLAAEGRQKMVDEDVICELGPVVLSEQGLTSALSHRRRCENLLRRVPSLGYPLTSGCATAGSESYRHMCRVRRSDLRGSSALRKADPFNAL